MTLMFVVPHRNELNSSLMSSRPLTVSPASIFSRMLSSAINMVGTPCLEARVHASGRTVPDNKKSETHRAVQRSSVTALRTALGSNVSLRRGKMSTSERSKGSNLFHLG
jgi:hypothetical protein